jgi:dephospho-CoA kinase
MTDLYNYIVTSPEYLGCFANVTVFGVAGTNGAGKDVLMSMIEERGFLWYNTSNHLRQVAQASLGSTKRGGNQSPLGRVGNAERSRYPGGMVELGLIDWWARAAHLPVDLQPRGLVIGSIRSISETRRLKEIGGKLIVIDADRRTRYNRIARRYRADEQGLSYEDFCREEDAELAVSETDPTKFSMAEVIAAADITITNDSSLDEIAGTLDAIIAAHA